MFKKIVHLAILILVMSCKTDDGIPDCSTVLCAAPVIIVNFIDDATDKNYILENNITKDDIQIQNGANNQTELIFDETTGMLFISRISNGDTLSIILDSDVTTSISYTVGSPKTNACCDFGTLENVIVENKTFEVENDTVTVYL
jgi:hypothetical protein